MTRHSKTGTWPSSSMGYSWNCSTAPSRGASRNHGTAPEDGLHVSRHRERWERRRQCQHDTVLSLRKPSGPPSMSVGVLHLSDGVLSVHRPADQPEETA